MSKRTEKENIKINEHKLETLIHILNKVHPGVWPESARKLALEMFQFNSILEAKQLSWKLFYIAITVASVSIGFDLWIWLSSNSSFITFVF